MLGLLVSAVLVSPTSASVATAASAPVLDDALIAQVNAGQHGWIAGRNPRFEGVSVQEAKRLVSGVLDVPPSSASPPHSKGENGQGGVGGPVPVDFDARSKWPACVRNILISCVALFPHFYTAFLFQIHPIRNQQTCGGCW